MAKVGAVQLPAALAIRSPIPPAAPIACSLLARGEGPERATKSEARGSIQPGIPGRCSHRQPAVLSIAQIEQRLPFYDGDGSIIHWCFYSFPGLAGRQFQNSIAHVREPLSSRLII